MDEPVYALSNATYLLLHNCRSSGVVPDCGPAPRLERHRLIIPARVAISGILLAMFAVESYSTIRYFRHRASSDGIVFLPGNNGNGFRLFGHDRGWQAWDECANWLHKQARSDAIVATSAPHLLYLYTGLHAVFPPMEADPARERRLLETVPISYLITDSFEFMDASRRYALPAIEDDPCPVAGHSLIWRN